MVKGGGGGSRLGTINVLVSKHEVKPGRSSLAVLFNLFPATNSELFV